MTPDTKSGCCMKRAAMWYSRWKVSMIDQFLPVRIWRRATFREVGERSEMVRRVFCAHPLMSSGALSIRFWSRLMISSTVLARKQVSIAARTGPERSMGSS